MRPRDLLAGFVDELNKIAAIQSEQLPVTSLPNQLVTTSLLEPLNSWSKTPDWSKNAPKTQKKPPNQGVAEESSVPAREANKVFFRPADDTQNKKKLEKTVNGNDMSAARQMQRDGSPIDAQSTADVSSANMISPAYGPGGT